MCFHRQARGAAWSGNVTPSLTDPPSLFAHCHSPASSLIINVTGGRAQVEAAYGPAENLGSFIRKIVGLSRAAAKAKFAAYLDEKRFSADQIVFIAPLIKHLTTNGVLDPPRPYEAPFTDLHFGGPEELVDETEIDALFGIIAGINAVAG